MTLCFWSSSFMESTMNSLADFSMMPDMLMFTLPPVLVLLLMVFIIVLLLEPTSPNEIPADPETMPAEPTEIPALPRLVILSHNDFAVLYASRNGLVIVLTTPDNAELILLCIPENAPTILFTTPLAADAPALAQLAMVLMMAETTRINAALILAYNWVKYEITLVTKAITCAGIV